MKIIYDKSSSLAAAARAIGIGETKLQMIRDAEGWPKKSTRRNSYKDRTPGRSIYDSVVTVYTSVPELDLP